MSALRVGFAGTPPFAATALEGLLEAGFFVPGVLTQPDRPAGRGLKLQASAVKQVALQHGLPLEQARSLKLDGRWPDDARHAQTWLESLNPDVLVVAAYGLILPAWVLKQPRLGCLNIHGSLLPRWRGAAPVQRAIEAGDAATGVTIMQMDEGLDTGAMLLTATQAIQAGDTSDTLLQRLAAQGSLLIVEALHRLQAGTLQAVAQPADGVTYAHKIEKSEAAIDWNLDAQQIERRIRAFDPFPGATFGVQGERIKLWRAEVVAGTHHEPSANADNPLPGNLLADRPGSLQVACGQGRLRLLELQPAGARRMPIQAFLQTPVGRLMQAGSRLDGPAAQPLD